MFTPFLGLCLLLVMVFALGGGSRGDILSLVILRPLSIILLGIGLVTLTRDHVRSHRFLFVMAALILLFLMVQLVPLPPSLWQALPGRDLVTTIDAAAGLAGIWRPMSLDPQATENAFFALLVPATVLVLGAQLTADEHRRLVPLLLIIGTVSALLGLLQVLSDPQGGLYFYRITNNGAPVGLFANRNHQALLLALMLPLLAYSSTHKQLSFTGSGLVILAGFVLLPLILVAGSRAGMFIGALALCSVPLLVASPVAPSEQVNRGSVGRHSFKSLVWFKGLVVMLGVSLILLTILLGRGLAWERISGTRIEDEMRWAIAPTVIKLVEFYFPWGTGTGSFERVFRIHEPNTLLGPTYMQQAHNDWLDALLTGGAIAGVLLVVVLLAWLLRISRLITRRSSSEAAPRLSFLGLTLVTLIGLASIVDYPLRVPSLACLFTLAALWASGIRSVTDNSNLTSGPETLQNPARLREPS